MLRTAQVPEQRQHVSSPQKLLAPLNYSAVKSYFISESKSPLEPEDSFFASQNPPSKHHETSHLCVTAKTFAPWSPFPVEAHNCLSEKSLSTHIALISAIHKRKTSTSVSLQVIVFCPEVRAFITFSPILFSAWGEAMKSQTGVIKGDGAQARSFASQHLTQVKNHSSMIRKKKVL